MKSYRLRHATLTVIGIAALLMHPENARAADLQLSLPIDCIPGRTCYIQNYVDMDSGSGVHDYACGRASYDGHKGTDFRLLSSRKAGQGVAVRAAAPGMVKAMRDGMADKLITRQDRVSIKGRECGNGLVITHGDGWETQYCHLRKGSVAVAKGQTVKRGQTIGMVGYSGKAQFAHLHITVRHNGRVIDPFQAATVGTACTAETKQGLWDETTAGQLVYSRGELIENTFAGAPVTPAILERGSATPMTATSDALLYYARLINLEKGDIIRLSITGPGGLKLNNKGTPLKRAKAHYVAYVGRKRRGAQWPPGRYKGRMQLIRSGKVVITGRMEMSIKH